MQRTKILYLSVVLLLVLGGGILYGLYTSGYLKIGADVPLSPNIEFTKRADIQKGIANGVDLSDGIQLQVAQ